MPKIFPYIICWVGLLTWAGYFSVIAIEPPIPPPPDNFADRYEPNNKLSAAIKRQNEINSIKIPPMLSHLNHDEVRLILFDGRLQDLPEKERNEYVKWTIEGEKREKERYLANRTFNQRHPEMIIVYFVVGAGVLNLLAAIGMMVSFGPAGTPVGLAPSKSRKCFVEPASYESSKLTKDEQFKKWITETQEFIESIPEGTKS